MAKEKKNEADTPSLNLEIKGEAKVTLYNPLLKGEKTSGINGIVEFDENGKATMTYDEAKYFLSIKGFSLDNQK